METGKTYVLRLYPAEKTILMIVAAIGFSAWVLAETKGIAVEYSMFFKPVLAGVVFVALGIMLRRTWNAERLALIVILAGAFVLDAIVFTTYNVMLLPRHMEPVDAFWVKVDAMLGYSWPAFCAWFANYPWLADFLRLVYSKAPLFLFMGYCVLAAYGNRERLHVSAYACLFASVITIAVWAVFPSAGASGYWTLDPAIDAIVRPPVNSAYGAQLNHVIVNGVHAMADLNVGGLIGFPSYHTVMAFVPVFAVWPYRPLRMVALLILALSVPGILMHGGHNLADVIAGALITAVSWMIAVRVHAAQELRPLQWKQAVPVTIPAE